MNNARKQAVRNTYNIIYNVNMNDVHTKHIQTSVRSKIEEQKTLNLLHDLDQKFLEWKINKKNTENEESCPVWYRTNSIK